MNLRALLELSIGLALGIQYSSVSSAYACPRGFLVVMGLLYYSEAANAPAQRQRTKIVTMSSEMLTMLTPKRLH
jgi:hypothetical protein